MRRWRPCAPARHSTRGVTQRRRVRAILREAWETAERPPQTGSGGGRWRWRWDLNPRRSLPLTRFRGVLLRPLGHATVDEGTERRRGRVRRRGPLSASR